MTRRYPSGEYEFKLSYPSAREVVLVGDFDAYGESQVPMARSPRAIGYVVSTYRRASTTSSTGSTVIGASTRILVRHPPLRS